MSKYPQHDKLHELRDKHDTVEEFIDFLRYDEDLFIMHQVVEVTDYSNGESIERVTYAPATELEFNHIIARYLGIDYDEFVAEKERIYQELREANANVQNG